MHSQVLDVTPNLAAQWLDKNVFNRPISHQTVSRYASDMRRGDWTLNHQGVAFDKQGMLADGQHRLMAIVKSDVSVPMMVTWGADTVGIDELRPRSVADVIKFGGISDWIDRDSVGTGKQMMLLFNSGREGSNALSVKQIADFCEKHREAIQTADHLFSRKTRGISVALIRACVAVSTYHFERDCIESFVKSLYSGIVNGEKESSVIRLREQLLDSGSSGGGSRRYSMAKKATRAIKAYAEAQPLARLMEPKSLCFNLPENDNE